jgi:hypothetical protein
VAEDTLLAELRAESNVQIHGCSTCLWIAEQDNADTWDAAFRDPEITTTAIYKRMVKLGYKQSIAPAKTHRQSKHRG